MPGVAVMTDSTSCLGTRQAAAAGVGVIPLQVVIDGESRPEGAGDAAAGQVARALREGRRVGTSRPTPEAFAAAYARLARAGHPAVVSVHLSRGMSATSEAATAAAASADVPVTVVDTGTVAMAAGFAVLAGAARATAGGSAEEVAEVVRCRAAASTTYFCVDSLEHLRRGGRIGAAAALLGAALAVRPLLTVSDGVIRPYERVRTAARALARLEQLSLAALAAVPVGSGPVDLAVHHLGAEAVAEALAERLRDRSPQPVDPRVVELSAVVGVHVGPGMLGVVVSPPC